MVKNTIEQRLAVQITGMEIQEDGEQWSLLYNHDTDPDLIEMVATMIRTNKRLSYVQLQDIDGDHVVARRGVHHQTGENNIA